MKKALTVLLFTTLVATMNSGMGAELDCFDGVRKKVSYAVIEKIHSTMDGLKKVANKFPKCIGKPIASGLDRVESTMPKREPKVLKFVRKAADSASSFLDEINQKIERAIPSLR